MYVVNYVVTKMVTEFNEVNEDWSGDTSDYGQIDSGMFTIGEGDWTADRLLKEIRDVMEPFVWDNVEYVNVWEDGRFSFCSTERGDGTPDVNGKYLVDYDLYATISSTGGEIEELDFSGITGVEVMN